MSAKKRTPPEPGGPPGAGWDYDENPFGAAEGAAGPPGGTRIVEGMSLDDYHATPEPSRSILWRMMSASPYDYHWEITHGGIQETDPMRLGSGLDAAVLTPDEFATRFDRWTVGRAAEWSRELGVDLADGAAADLESGHTEKPARKAGNLWRAVAAEAERRGVTMLSGDAYDKAIELRDWVLGRKGIRNLFRNGVAQTSFFAVDQASGIAFKSRPDWRVVHGDTLVLVDLKSTYDLGPLEAPAWKLMHRAKQSGLHVQGAMAVDAAMANMPEIARVEWHLFWVRTKGAPWARLTEMDADAIDEGREVYRAALPQWKKCVETGIWPTPRFKPEKLPWERTF